MARTLNKRLNRVAAAVVLAVALLAVGATQSIAATYPKGTGSTFSGSAEGWNTTSATCNVTILASACSASGGFDAAGGQPAGSMAASTSILVNLLGLFTGNVSEESPAFTVGDGGAGAVRLEREFAPGGLIGLEPKVSYTVSLVDKTAGTETEVFAETLTAATPFGAKAGPVALVAGHTYTVRIDSATNSTVASVGLLGATTTRFDNVSVTGPGANPGGENGKNGKDGITSSELRSLMQSSLIGPAVLINGKRILVKAKCPAKVGRACNITLTGMFTKRKAATARRVGRVAKGKKRPLLLRVKPKAKARVKQSRTLLFKETVRAGKAHATVYKRLKLIKRG